MRRWLGRLAELLGVMGSLRCAPLRQSRSCTPVAQPFRSRANVVRHSTLGVALSVRRRTIETVVRHRRFVTSAGDGGSDVFVHLLHRPRIPCHVAGGRMHDSAIEAATSGPLFGSASMIVAAGAGSSSYTLPRRSTVSAVVKVSTEQGRLQRPLAGSSLCCRRSANAANTADAHMASDRHAPQSWTNEIPVPTGFR